MDKLSYALGMSIAHNLINSGVKSLNIVDFTDGLTDVMTDNEVKMGSLEANQVIENYFKKIQDEMISTQKKIGEEFLKNNANDESVVVVPSGLQYKVLVEGTGKKPNSHSQVKVNYEGRFIDGQVFDSSYKRGEPVGFGLDSVIAGWTEGLQLMREGSKYELYIPYNLAYGENGIPNAIPPYSTLIFTVELLEVK